MAGTQVEATCSLKAMLEGTRPAGSNEVSWADEENSGSEGSNSRAGGGFRAPLSKVEVANDGSVQTLIKEIRVASERLGVLRHSDEASAALTPLLGKRKKSREDLDCIRGWQGMLECLHMANGLGGRE